MNPATGELSGSTKPLKIKVEQGGLSITNIASKNDRYITNVYISDTDGADLYFHSSVAVGVSFVDIRKSHNDKHLIATLNMSEMIGGSIIQPFNGRLYSANDTVLWYSQPLRYGLLKKSSDFYLFASRITIVQPVDNGLYIVADKTYFLSGEDPSNIQLKEISNLTAIEGTGLTLDTSNFAFDKVAPGRCAYWMSSQGAVVGLPSGRIIEYAKDRLAVPKDMVKGTSTYIEDDGIHRLVTSLDVLGGNRNNVGAGDNAVATLIRNGIEIN